MLPKSDEPVDTSTNTFELEVETASMTLGSVDGEVGCCSSICEFGGDENVVPVAVVEVRVVVVVVGVVVGTVVTLIVVVVALVVVVVVVVVDVVVGLVVVVAS